MENSKIKVLLVEDEPIVQMIHRHMLEKLGCSHDIAADGKQALSLLDNNYDVILMDIGLPDLSGVEVTKLIRTRERAADSKTAVPIIGLTAFGEDDIQERGIAAGMNEITIKPISETILQEIFERWIEPTTA